MKVYIKYLDNKILLDIKKYESVNSIINSFINENLERIKNTHYDYTLDYNGLNLNKNYSLEKYNIKDDSILTLYPKLKGGNNFFSFVMSHPMISFISLIIILIPLIMLPLGFIPTIASFLEVLILKTSGAIFKFLVCDYGKITIYNRFGFVVKIVKYITLFLMIFCLITFPLIVLCMTLKGHSVLDDPKNMCKPISAGNTAGMIVSIIYFIIYFCYRGVDWIVNPLLNFIKRFYELNLLISPILKSILRLFDKFKYVILFLIPFIGEIFMAYFLFLGTLNDAVQMILDSIIDIGCGSTISSKMFKSKFISKIKKFVPPNTNEEKNKNNSEKNINNAKYKEIEDEYGEIFGIHTPLCTPDLIACCSPDKFLKIADIISGILEADDLTTMLIKNKGLYPALVLLCEGLYDSALDILNKPENQDKNDNIKGKIEKLNMYMINYSKETGSGYTPGSSLFKTIFKVLFVDVVCNFFQTTKSTKDVLTAMGPIAELTDMLKSGTAAGFFTAISYFIAIIILIFCGIFNYF